MTIKSNWTRALAVTSVQLLLSVSPTMVWAIGNLQESYQEVSYDDLISELNSKHTSALQLQTEKQNAPLRQTRLGVGFVHSFTQLNVKNELTERSQNGLQLAGSMNLDSPNMYAEGLFRNFSGSTLSNENLQIQQVDGRIGFRNELNATWKYTLLSGLSLRYIQAQNSAKGYAVNELGPAFTAGFGAVSEIHKNISVGFEVSGRTALLGSTAEKTSADVSVRLDTTL